MAQNSSRKQSAGNTLPAGIPIVAILMILIGLAEGVTGFTHNFSGLNKSPDKSKSERCWLSK